MSLVLSGAATGKLGLGVAAQINQSARRRPALPGEAIDLFRDRLKMAFGGHHIGERLGRLDREQLRERLALGLATAEVGHGGDADRLIGRGPERRVIYLVRLGQRRRRDRGQEHAPDQARQSGLKQPIMRINHD